jgi:hypothetical protein
VRTGQGCTHKCHALHTRPPPPPLRWQGHQACCLPLRSSLPLTGGGCGGRADLGRHQSCGVVARLAQHLGHLCPGRCCMSQLGCRGTTCPAEMKGAKIGHGRWRRVLLGCCWGGRLMLLGWRIQGGVWAELILELHPGDEQFGGQPWTLLCARPRAAAHAVWRGQTPRCPVWCAACAAFSGHAQCPAILCAMCP